MRLKVLSLWLPLCNSGMIIHSTYQYITRVDFVNPPSSIIIIRSYFTVCTPRVCRPAPVCFGGSFARNFHILPRRGPHVLTFKWAPKPIYVVMLMRNKLNFNDGKNNSVLMLSCFSYFFGKWGVVWTKVLHIFYVRFEIW